MSDFPHQNRYFFTILKISLFLSLTLLVLIFYFFPRFPRLSTGKETSIQIQIYVSEIPRTQQLSHPKPPPVRPFGMIPVPTEDADLPAEIEEGAVPSVSPGETDVTGLIPEIPARPILEVYPTVSGLTCKGYVRLLLLINNSGYTETIEIIENTTGSDTCLTQVLEAVRKSRWLPATVNDRAVNSWVTKTYKFNPKN